MAVKGFIDHLVAGPVADARRFHVIREAREARQHSASLANTHAKLATEFAGRARDAHAAAGGSYAAFRGKKLAPQTPSLMRDANGLAASESQGADVLSEAIGWDD